MERQVPWYEVLLLRLRLRAVSSRRPGGRVLFATGFGEPRAAPVPAGRVRRGSVCC